MFDTFKLMGAMAGLMKDRGRLEEAAESVKSAIEAVRAGGSAGGGAVRAVATGSMTIESIEIDPAIGAGFGDPQSKQMAQHLITEASNEALRSARDQVRKILEEAARDLGLPELGGFAGNLLP